MEVECLQVIRADPKAFLYRQNVLPTAPKTILWGGLSIKRRQVPAKALASEIFEIIVDILDTLEQAYTIEVSVELQESQISISISPITASFVVGSEDYAIQIATHARTERIISFKRLLHQAKTIETGYRSLLVGDHRFRDWNRTRLYYSMLIDSKLDEINTISLLTALQTVLVEFLGQEIRVDSCISERKLELVSRIRRRKQSSYHG
ncbi:MAG: hypothetical protein ACFFB3_10345 [Candidatus Hodarchaeota archaeon]